MAAISKRYRALRKKQAAISEEIRFLKETLARLKPQMDAADKLQQAGLTPDDLEALKEILAE